MGAPDKNYILEICLFVWITSIFGWDKIISATSDHFNSPLGLTKMLRIAWNGENFDPKILQTFNCADTRMFSSTFTLLEI